MERRVTFSAPDITCDGCAQHIHEELDDAPGIQKVEVDVPHKRVYVIFDPERTTIDQVQDELDQAGFPARTEAVGPTARATRTEPAAMVEGTRKRPSQLAEGSKSLGYWLLVLGAAVLALAGYVGYELYPRFDLPAAEGAALLLLAAGAGIASFFSPCAFPLLVALLARETGVEKQEDRSPWARALTFATALSIGTATFLLLAGFGIALGGGALFAGVTFTSTVGMSLRVIVGALLILLGLVQLQLLPNPLHAVERLSAPLMKSQARHRRTNPTLGFGIFGFGYVLAGFG